MIKNQQIYSEKLIFFSEGINTTDNCIFSDFSSFFKSTSYERHQTFVTHIFLSVSTLKGSTNNSAPKNLIQKHTCELVLPVNQVINFLYKLLYDKVVFSKIVVVRNLQI